MLEIAFLVWFCRKLASIAKGKGRSGSWGALGALLWIGGEISGFVVGTLADAEAGSYLVALLFAGLGAVVAYVIVSALKSEAAAVWGNEDLSSAPARLAPPYDPSNPYAPPRA